MGTNQRASIVMSEDEIGDFVDKSRTGTLATVGPDGQPHLTAMWYAVVDGEIWLETKAKSQKAVNLKRDPRVSFLIEGGQSYDTLRGVSFDGVAEIVDDPDTIFRVGVSVWERYTGPYTDDMKPFVDQMMNKRIAVRIVARRARSWPWRSTTTSGRFWIVTVGGTFTTVIPEVETVIRCGLSPTSSTSSRAAPMKLS